MAYATKPGDYPRLSLYVDGIWSEGGGTAYALQYDLRRTGYYTTAYKLDGKFGPASIKALQRYLRDKGRHEAKYTGKIDGLMGNMTRDCYADYLSNGGNPYGWHCYYLGVYPSRWPDYALTGAIQRFLNNRR